MFAYTRLFAFQIRLLIFFFLGAFEVGCVVPRKSKMIPELAEKIEVLIFLFSFIHLFLLLIPFFSLTIVSKKDLTIVVFMPLFFTYSGLRTELGLLNDGKSWGYFILILVVAFGSKSIGCAISAR